MSNLAFHPAPGLGDLMAGYFVVPQDPITAAAQGVSVVPALGDFIDASFVVPQNPLLAQVTGTVAPVGQGWAGKRIRNPKAQGMSGCGCGGSCGGCGGGMGTISTDLSTWTSDLEAGNWGNLFTDTILGIPAWIYMAAGIAVFTMSRKSGTMRRSY